MEMSDNSKMIIFSEQYENGNTGDTVEGITILIDGKMKQMLDAIMANEKQYANYVEVVRDMLFTGINTFISKDR
jgi:hypothetical protein